MRLVSYQFKQQPHFYRIGCMFNEQVFDLQAAYQKLLVAKGDKHLANVIDHVFPADPTLFFSQGLHVIEKGREAYQYIMKHKEQITLFSREEIKLGTPIPHPEKIICVGKNYADHVAEMKSEIPKVPVLFSKFNNALIGPEDAIKKTPHTNKLDYEVELVIVIGKEATQVSREKAYQYIAGYTIGNDISARDLQMRTPQWLLGKSLDHSTPVGPWVVTADELTDPANLEIRSFVNGELRQNSNTKQFIFDIPFLIEFITSLITLKPGDVIFTGTPDGVGFGMKPQQFLNIGDQVVTEIEHIGKMENVVTDEIIKRTE